MLKQKKFKNLKRSIFYLLKNLLFFLVKFLVLYFYFLFPLFDINIQLLHNI